MDVPIAALAPVVVAALAWIWYCLRDLARSEVRYLPRWGWVLVIVVSVPVGGIVYLLAGRRSG